MKVSDVSPAIPRHEYDQRPTRIVQISADELMTIFHKFGHSGIGGKMVTAVLAPAVRRPGRAATEIAQSSGGEASLLFAAAQPPGEALLALMISPTDEEMDGY